MSAHPRARTGTVRGTFERRQTPFGVRPLQRKRGGAFVALHPCRQRVYEQVYFRNFLERINAKNPALALLERPNTYLVEGMEEDFLKYMQHHYEEDIELEYVNEIDGHKVYRLIRTTKRTNQQDR